MTTDLNSLMMFARVVEANSFSQAARRMRMPTSTLSRRVSELERQLGVRLIERSTRSLRLTHAGSEIFEHAKKSSDINDAVMNIASNHVTGVSGLIRISVPPTLLDSVLNPVIFRFHQQHPDARVRIFVTDRIVNQIEEDIDLAFRVGPLDSSSLVVRHVLSYSHQLFASPAYLAERDIPCCPSDLLSHRLIAFSSWTEDNTWRFSHVRNGQNESIDFQPHLSINHYSEVASLLRSGAGIGELPPMIPPQLTHDDDLIRIMPEWRFEPVDLSIVHLGDRFAPRAVRLFKDLAAEVIPTIFRCCPGAREHLSPPRNQTVGAADLRSDQEGPAQTPGLRHGLAKTAVAPPALVPASRAHGFAS